MSDLPTGWEWTTLGDLAAAEPRAITDGPFGSNLKSNHYTGSGARVIRLQNIGDGEFRDERAYIDLERFQLLRAHEVCEGDLVVASLGDAPPRACLVPALGGPAIVKADCIRVRLAPHVVPQWVLYSLLAPATKAHAKTLIKGMGRPRLGLAHIRNFAIPVPPLAEQYRIVDELDAQLSRLDRAVLVLAGAEKRLPAALSALRSQLLTHDDRVSRRGVLGDMLDRIEAGRSFGGASRRAEVGEWGIVKVSAMTWGRFDPRENKYVPAESADPRYEIHAGDILVSRANTEAYVGAPVLVGDVRAQLLLSDKSLRLVPKPGVDRRWLLNTLASPAVRRHISKVATGTKDSMRNISQAGLLQAPITIPPTEVQSALADDVEDRREDLDRLARAVVIARGRAEQLRRAILADAFAGRLVAQDPDDEPASVLLERIRSQRPVAPQRRSARRS